MIKKNYMKKPYLKNYDFTQDNFIISCSFATKYFICDGKKIAFLKIDIILLIKSQISNIFIPNNFSQSYAKFNANYLSIELFISSWTFL